MLERIRSLVQQFNSSIRYRTHSVKIGMLLLLLLMLESGFQIGARHVIG